MSGTLMASISKISPEQRGYIKKRAESSRARKREADRISSSSYVQERKWQ